MTLLIEDPGGIAYESSVIPAEGRLEPRNGGYTSDGQDWYSLESL